MRVETIAQGLHDFCAERFAFAAVQAANARHLADLAAAPPTLLNQIYRAGSGLLRIIPGVEDTRRLIHEQVFSAHADYRVPRLPATQVAVRFKRN